MKTFFIDNHGCAKNQVDAEEIASRLKNEGWKHSNTSEDADLIIVNSCGFIEDAKKESIDSIIGWRNIYPDKKILLAGCLAQRYANEFHDDLTEADAFFGNHDLSLLMDAVDSAMNSTRQIIKPEKTKFTNIERTSFQGFPRTAYLKITEGCNNHCSFCAIPIIRGELCSRTIDEVVKEFKFLLKQDFYEICLVGQDLGSYGLDIAKDGLSLLPELLSQLSNIDGDFRLRMLYIHPDKFDRRILPIIAKDKRIAPYFDIPFQHASGSLLKAMNRKGNPEIYLQLLKDIRTALPEAVIRSTFLLGFPGETDEDFEQLLKFQQEAQIDWLGSFTYSREEDTPAYSMKNKVSKKLANKRKKIVEDAQTIITQNKLKRFVGTKQTVIVEEPIEGEDLAIARAYMNAPDVDGSIVVGGQNLKAGLVLDVVITSCAGLDLDSVPISEKPLK